MEQLQKKSIEELLAISREEGAAYMKTLTPEERERVGNELHKAISKRTAEAMVASLNKHASKQTVSES